MQHTKIAIIPNQQTRTGYRFPIFIAEPWTAQLDQTRLQAKWKKSTSDSTSETKLRRSPGEQTISYRLQRDLGRGSNERRAKTFIVDDRRSQTRSKKDLFVISQDRKRFLRVKFKAGAETSQRERGFRLFRVSLWLQKRRWCFAARSRYELCGRFDPVDETARFRGSIVRSVILLAESSWVSGEKASFYASFVYC